MPSTEPTSVLSIRRAVAGDAGELTELALRSKAYWNYDQEFIRDCRAELTLTPDYIAAHTVFVSLLGERITGFYTLRDAGNDSAELDHLYVEPALVGHGHGKRLWLHAMKNARDLNYHHVTIHSDPNAERFYLAMGAVRVGEVLSPVRSGRTLPLMRYIL